jgi:hypothetical protein
VTTRPATMCSAAGARPAPGRAMAFAARAAGQGASLLSSRPCAPIAEIVLRRGPVERHALARPSSSDRPEGGRRLLQPRRPASDRSSAAASAPPGTRNTCWTFSARCSQSRVNLDSLPCVPVDDYQRICDWIATMAYRVPFRLITASDYVSEVRGRDDVASRRLFLNKLAKSRASARIGGRRTRLYSRARPCFE